MEVRRMSDSTREEEETEVEGASRRVPVAFHSAETVFESGSKEDIYMHLCYLYRLFRDSLPSPARAVAFASAASNPACS